MWSWNFDLDDDLEKAKKKTQAMYGASTPTMQDSAGNVIQQKTGLSTAQIKQDWDAANPWARRNQGSTAPVPPVAPATPWKVSTDGLMMKNTPAQTFVPLPTKPAAGFQGLPTTPRGTGGYARTGDANMDLRLRNAGVLPYLPARQGQPSPAALALQKREAYQARQQKAADDAEAAKQMAKTMTLDDFLAKPGALTDAEKMAANKVLKRLDQQYQPIRREYQGSPRDGTGARPLPEDVKMILAKMDALRLKAKASEAALYGGLDSVTFGLSNRWEKGENEKRIGEYEAKLAAGQPLTKTEEADLLMLRSLGGGTSFQAAQEQNSLAYGAGKYGVNMVKYALGNKALDMIPGVGAAMGKAGQWISGKTGGKVSAELAKRLVEGRVQDLPFDLVNAAVETDSPEEFAMHLGTNQAMGLGTDIGFEVLAAGWRAIKEAAKNGRLKQYVDPENIKDADIDAYTAKLHGEDAPKTEVLGSLPEQRAMPVLTMERMPETKINPGARKSIRELAGELPKEGYAIPKFNSKSSLFIDSQGQAISASKYPTAVKKYMMENFKGKVLDIGPDRVYVNKAGIEEFSFPARRMQEAERLAKFSAGEHLDQTLEPARFLLNVADANGRHPDVVGGWDNYYVMFQVDDDIYSGIVKTKNTAKGRQFYDISEIQKEDVPPATRGDNGHNPPPAMPGTSSINSIPPGSAKINGQNGGNSGGGFDPLTAPMDAANQARARAEETMKAFLPGKEAAENGRLGRYLDPENIKDADIDAYMAKLHGEDAPKTEVIKGSDLSKQISQETYWDQINRVMRGENPPDIIKIGQTPEILKQYGAKDRTITMKPSAVRKIAYPAGYMDGKHNLGFYALEHLPEQLENPVAILKSSTQDNSLVIFTEFLNERGSPVLAAVHLDKEGRLGLSNEIASVYGKDTFQNFIEEQRALGNLVYEDKKRTLDQLPGVGLQLPKMEADADPIFNIPRSGSKINGQNGGNSGGGFDPLTAPMDAANQARARAEETMKAFLPENAAKNAPTLPTKFDEPFTDDFGQAIQAPGGYGQNTVGAAQSAFQYKQQVSKSYDNTFQKTPLFTQAEKELANAAGMDKTFSYDVMSEKKSMAEAAQRFAFDAAGEMEDLPKKGSWGSSDLDTAMLILEQKRDQWRKTGNHDDLVEWAKMVQEKGTEAGQMIQAFAKYSRTPEGTIIKAEGAIADYAKKLREANPKLFNAIDEFAEELERVSLDFRYDMPADPDAATAKLKNAVEEFAKKHSKVKLDDETTDEIIRAIKEGRGGKDAIGDILQAAEGIPQLSAEDVGNVLDLMAKAEDFPLYSKERYKLENQAWKIVADHFDSSFMDKWNAWRYMAMLGNTRTHIRNTVGNTVFGAVVTIKDRLGAVLEGVTDHTARAFGGKGIERTKSIFAPLDRELNKAAKNDFNDMYALVAGNGKYNPSNMIRDNMTVFKTKWLEKLRKLNLGALEAEDAVALKARYADSLAGWLKANGYGVDIFKEDASETAQETLTWARAYAIEQAQKATFRDDSQLATALSNMSRSSKAANVIIEGIVPFKKTPINIVKRGIEYSFVGLAKGVSEAISAVKTGRKTAAEAIDHIASGLTGTGIMYLGYKLAENGLITGSSSEDSRERGFDAMTGNQNYALVIDGKSYTLDWAAPAALPLFVGVECFKTKGSGLTSAGLLDSVTKITEPALDMTMLQGLNDTIKSAAYDQTGPLASIGVNAVSNYATQAVPTLFGQVARAVDDTRRSTYYGGGAFLDRFLPENVKKAAAEIPGVQGIIDATLPKPVDIAAQKTMAKIPGLSMLLNPKVDQWGREQKNQGGSFGGRLAYNMLSPGYYSQQNYTDVDREIERLYGESGEKGVLPGYAAKTIAQKDADGNKETKRLSAGEFVRFAKDKGGAAYESLGALFQSEAYQAAGDDDKAQMVADIYEYTNAAAKTGVSNYKPSGWVEKAMEAKKDGITLEEYVLCRNVLTPLKHNVEKNEKLLDMDADPKRKETLYKYFVSDSESSRKKIDAFRAVGLDMDDYLTAQIEYAHIDDEGGSAQEKATAFYQWLDRQGLSDREYQAVAQSMPFFQMFPAKPQAYRVGLASDKVQAAYTSLSKNYGISEDNFMVAFNAVQDVEGVKDRSGKTISGSQKKARFRALAELPGWNASGAKLFLMAVYGYKDEKWT